MELIFGLLPLPVAVVVLVATGVGVVLVKKFAKKQSARDLANSVGASVLTEARIDQTVEAVLAKLRVDPALADKIGDFIADIVVNAMGARSKLAATSERMAIHAALVDGDGGVDPTVAQQVVAGPTPLRTVIESAAERDVLSSEPAVVKVAAGVVKAYAENRVI